MIWLGLARKYFGPRHLDDEFFLTESQKSVECDQILIPGSYRGAKEGISSDFMDFWFLVKKKSRHPNAADQNIF